MHRDMLVHHETNAYLHVATTWEKVLEVRAPFACSSTYVCTAMFSLACFFLHGERSAFANLHGRLNFFL